MRDKARLVKQWTYGHASYRLISVARFIAGYDDDYIMEKAEKDALGCDRWVQVYRWAQDETNNDLMNILAEGCK